MKTTYIHPHPFSQKGLAMRGLNWKEEIKRRRQEAEYEKLVIRESRPLGKDAVL